MVRVFESLNTFFSMYTVNLYAPLNKMHKPTCSFKTGIEKSIFCIKVPIK